VTEHTGQKCTIPAHLMCYDDLVVSVSYGYRPEFDVALASVVTLTEQTIQKGGTGRADRRDIASEEVGGPVRPRAEMVHTLLAGQLNGARV